MEEKIVSISENDKRKFVDILKERLAFMKKRLEEGVGGSKGLAIMENVNQFQARIEEVLDPKFDGTCEYCGKVISIKQREERPLSDSCSKCLAQERKLSAAMA